MKSEDLYCFTCKEPITEQQCNKCIAAGFSFNYCEDHFLKEVALNKEREIFFNGWKNSQYDTPREYLNSTLNTPK